MRGFHRFLVAERLAGSDPSRQLGSPKVPAALPKALTVEQVEALLTVVEGDVTSAPDAPARARAQRDAALLELLYAAGLRVSEATALDIDDLDLEAGSVRAMGKGGRERLVPVGRTARAAVTRWLEVGRPLLARPRTGAALFVNAQRTRLTRARCNAWSATGRSRRADRSRRPVTPHALRHSFATHLLDGERRPALVQELLGHASLATTQLYTQLTDERLLEVYLSAHPRARRR